MDLLSLGDKGEICMSARVCCLCVYVFVYVCMYGRGNCNKSIIRQRWWLYSWSRWLANNQLILFLYHFRLAGRYGGRCGGVGTFSFFREGFSAGEREKKSGAPRDRWNIYIEKSKMNKKTKK